MKYPYTIDNGHGETITFLGRTIRDGIEYLEVENCVGPGHGPPMHVHFHQDESLTVIEGTLVAEQPGEPPCFFGPGESITFRRGVMHSFKNAGEVPLKCRGNISPPDNIEYFLTEIFRSTKAGKGRPSAFDSAFLLSHFSSEYDMKDIPKFVKKVIFPVIIFTGKLKGLHKKYSNAPAPVKKSR